MQYTDDLDYIQVENKKSRRGFASMDPDKQRQIASKGGKASGGNFAHNPARAAIAGRKGGQNRTKRFAMA